MAKQKIVVKVTLKNNKNFRKALQIAASQSGVHSVALVDEENITVTGEGIGSVELTYLLRKRVGHTELVSVGREETVLSEYSYPQDYYGNNYVPLQVVHEIRYNTCSIL